MSQAFKDEARRILAAVGRDMYGIDEVVRLSLVAFYCGGHVLLEGNPGLGKTQLVKSLAAALGLGFRRIQFTPDLMPADITGTFLPDPESPATFRFVPGPIFTSVLLADEINRATPKTQAAMLEGMAEGRVTVLGKTHDLPRPFFVLATQNPIDHEGTYELPKAQTDRFLFKVLMPSPDRATLDRIVDKDAGVRGMDRNVAATAVLGEDPAARHQVVARAIREASALDVVRQHVLNLVLATNGRLQDLEPRSRDRVRGLVDGTIAYGLGPRAATALLVGAKAYALLFLDGETRAVGSSLAAIAPAALVHRLVLELDWEVGFREAMKAGDDVPMDVLRARWLAELLVATAPPTPAGYREEVAARLGGGAKAAR